jgi:hypothetical protein
MLENRQIQKQEDKTSVKPDIILNYMKTQIAW